MSTITSHSREPLTDPPEHCAENNPFRSSHSSRSPRSSRSSPSKSVRHSSTALSHRPTKTRPHFYQGHRKISSVPGADLIDRLGSVMDTPYHHDGPYDATLFARQIHGYSPVEAVKESNAAAIRATPRANIVDSLEKHYPMQGTAVVPPGVNGMEEYEEYDVQRLDGGYRRWAHGTYRDEDLKGKGEPWYTMEEFDKQQKAARKAKKAQAQTQTQRSNEIESSEKGIETENENGLSLSESLSGRLRKRFSIRRKN